MAYIVIGNGQAGTWSKDASAVTRGDVDLLRAAKDGDLYERGAHRRICSLAGRLYDDAWLLVANATESDLDADPAVVAYCTAP